MKAALAALIVATILAAGCAQSKSTTVAAQGGGRRAVPAKCTACHLAPAEHSLAAERWPAYIKAHQRRLPLSDEDRTFLYDFLVGGELPRAQTP
jgi:hypothetical protein